MRKAGKAVFSAVVEVIYRLTLVLIFVGAIVLVCSFTQSLSPDNVTTQTAGDPPADLKHLLPPPGPQGFVQQPASTAITRERERQLRLERRVERLEAMIQTHAQQIGRLQRLAIGNGSSNGQVTEESAEPDEPCDPEDQPATIGDVIAEAEGDPEESR